MSIYIVKTVDGETREYKTKSGAENYIGKNPGAVLVDDVADDVAESVDVGFAFRQTRTTKSTSASSTKKTSMDMVIVDPTTMHVEIPELGLSGTAIAVLSALQNADSPAMAIGEKTLPDGSKIESAIVDDSLDAISVLVDWPIDESHPQHAEYVRIHSDYMLPCHASGLDAIGVVADPVLDSDNRLYFNCRLGVGKTRLDGSDLVAIVMVCLGWVSRVVKNPYRMDAKKTDGKPRTNLNNLLGRLCWTQSGEIKHGNCVGDALPAIVDTLRAVVLDS